MLTADCKQQSSHAAQDQARQPTARRRRVDGQWSARRIVRAVLEFIAIEVIGRALYYSGALCLVGWLRQRVGRRRLLIPMYHRVRPAGDPARDALIGVQRGLSRDLFDQHVRVFRWFGRLLTLDQALDHLHGSDGPRSAIALTFDDGYRDNFTEALPVLRKYDAAATVFPVVRTASGGRPLWWDELSQIIRDARVHGDRDLEAIAATLLEMELPDCDVAPAEELVRNNFPVSHKPDAQARVSGNRPSLALRACVPRETRGDAEVICRRLVPLAQVDRDRRLELLAQRLGVDRQAARDADLYATWDELRTMAAAGVEVGSHTIDHVVLSCEAPEVVHQQLAGSKRAIEQQLRRPVSCLSYPNGGHDGAVHELAAAAGYRAAVTVEHGVNHSDTDPFQLRRVPIGQERPFHLALKLAFYDFVHRD
jgi:peptidoglycan/xylan/chitin deacetylase (PgdA/CDA1 family)